MHWQGIYALKQSAVTFYTDTHNHIPKYKVVSPTMQSDNMAAIKLSKYNQKMTAQTRGSDKYWVIKAGN